MKTPSLCPICQHPAQTLNEAHPGYKQPDKFAIAECGYCDIQFCDPMTISDGLYELIYKHAGTLPGYSRYRWYADRVSRQKNPLAWLAAQEQMYAFVGDQLARRANLGRVIEIGSGFGYLTFALHRAGYDVLGLELSQRAVTAARASFGDLYEVGDVTTLDAPRFFADAVVMTELLEHLPDPAGVLRRVNAMLRPGGLALITTPNKSAFPKGAYWMTDNPPVHLWWFSETALRRLAESNGFTISFHCSELQQTLPLWPSYFDEKGQQTFPSNWVRKLLDVAPGVMLPVIRVARHRRQRRDSRQVHGERDATMCVVLQKPITPTK